MQVIYCGCMYLSSADKKYFVDQLLNIIIYSSEIGDNINLQVGPLTTYYFLFCLFSPDYIYYKDGLCQCIGVKTTALKFAVIQN